MRPCVLKCNLHGSQKCGACPIPDERGKARCPDCREPLYVIGGGKFACSNLTGCGKSVTVPIGNPDREAAAQAELAEFKRQKARDRKRESRERQRLTWTSTGV